MQLYTYYRSSAAYRVRIALNLKNLDYTSVPVHLVKDGGQHRHPDYLVKNPQGLVPMLEHGKQVLTQSLAIIEYLDEVYPKIPLLPDSPLERARVRSIAQSIACDIHPLNNLRVLRYLASDVGLDEDKKSTWYRHWIDAGFSALEKEFTSSARAGQYCFGDAPGLADCCLVPQIYNANRFDVNMQAYPTLSRINQACLELDAFRNAAPEAQADAD